MWFKKSIENLPDKPKGTVDYSINSFPSHYHFFGGQRFGMDGMLVGVEMQINKSYRHCMIGKIELKNVTDR